MFSNILSSLWSSLEDHLRPLLLGIFGLFRRSKGNGSRKKSSRRIPALDFILPGNGIPSLITTPSFRTPLRA